jgi:hypothetical protein
VLAGDHPVEKERLLKRGHFWRERYPKNNLNEKVNVGFDPVHAPFLVPKFGLQLSAHLPEQVRRMTW